MNAEESQSDRLFVEVDEEDPFEYVNLRVTTEDGASFGAGAIKAEPGRYELRKVGENDD